MGEEKMRKVVKKLLTVAALVLVLGGVVCCHVHNEECGYDEQTGKGCVYEKKPLLSDRPFGE